MVSTIFAQALDSSDIPDVAWSGLMPLLIMSAGAILLITIVSLMKDSVPSWFTSVFTGVVTAASCLGVAATIQVLAHNLCGTDYTTNPSKQAWHGDRDTFVRVP